MRRALVVPVLTVMLFVGAWFALSNNFRSARETIGEQEQQIEQLHKTTQALAAKTERLTERLTQQRVIIKRIAKENGGTVVIQSTSNPTEFPPVPPVPSTIPTTPPDNTGPLSEVCAPLGLACALPILGGGGLLAWTGSRRYLLVNQPAPHHSSAQD